LKGFEAAYEAFGDTVKRLIDRVDDRLGDIDKIRRELERRKVAGNLKASLNDSELSHMSESELMARLQEL
ncbi:hypothetical protein, partial [Staphylococcus aureus]